MKKKNGTFWFYLILIVSILMVNPPIVYWINDYCVAHPITFGWPTMFLWLEFWYVVMVIDFIVAAVKLKAWDCHQDKKEIVPESRTDH
jgi:hypothetical protein